VSRNCRLSVGEVAYKIFTELNSVNSVTFCIREVDRHNSHGVKDTDTVSGIHIQTQTYNIIYSS